ncbi:hypothetical protein Gbfr_045_009 [Gluconobacter frateurii M-2]|nr:hypothetical protein Gbfr_045_009 [Gluconobacter frateurii M-2]
MKPPQSPRNDSVSLTPEPFVQKALRMKISELVDQIAETTDAAKKGEEISLPGFGKF